MKKLRVISTLLMVCSLMAAICQSCSTAPYERTQDGVIVRLDDRSDFPGQAVQLRVINDRIIRVTAIARGDFPATESLMVLPQPEDTIEFTIEEGEGQVTLGTSLLSAEISLITGEVVFTDTEGTVIAAEQEGGGRSFTPVMVKGESCYNVRQQFESPDDCIL